jgi:dipeptidyl aminopeptidase/acylaminoacyl peptidase
MLYTYANNADNRVQTVVSLAGPTNLTDTRYATPQSMGLVAALLGVSPTVNPQAYINASPSLRVNANSKPTLIFHGRKDATVNVQQSIDLEAVLDQANVKNKLVIYETTGHEVVNSGNIASFYNDLDSWLIENLK